MKTAVRYACIVPAIVVLVCVVLIAMGKVKVIWSNSGQFTISPNVCSSEQVRTFNTIYKDGSVSKDVYKPLYDAVVSQNGYKADANCVYIAAVYGMVTSDKDILMKNYQQLKALSDSGHGISLNFDSIQTLSNLKTAADSLANGDPPQAGE